MQRFVARGALSLLGAVGALGLAVPGAQAAPADYTAQMVHFNVTVGPPDARETCSIVGELFKPDGASATHPVPSVLTTNGFGGSYADQVPFAETLANRGYAVLTYSGLGFGGSGCQIELDSPAWDGQAASQLITFLGGGSASTEGVRVNYVHHDTVAHDGRAHPDDPRVGMIGGSYGGEIQFAAADVDPRLDAIVPVITWNDLAYSLAPNNAYTGADLAERSGVSKYQWIDLFSGLGIADGLQGISADPNRDVGCPNFDSRACSAMVELNTIGNPNPQTLGFAEQASVSSYIDHVRIPTMLMQGEDDTLFNLHEAVATYHELQARHTPVKLVFQSWGHSDSTPAPGEYSDSFLNPDGTWTTEGKLVEQWFGHYLAGAPAAPALNFSYYQPWINAPAAHADDDYASAPRYPLPATSTLHLSGTGGLIGGDAAAVTAGSDQFVVPPAGAPTSSTEISAVSQSVPLYDAPGTFAEFETAPLSQAETVVGVPSLSLSLADSLETADGSLDPSGGLALYAKLEDIAPDGTVTLPDRLISPARFENLDAPVQIELPGIVHRFAAGDRIALIVCSTDGAYHGNDVPSSVTVSTSPAEPGTLTLPLATPGATSPLVFASVPARALRHHAHHPKRPGRRHRHRTGR